MTSQVLSTQLRGSSVAYVSGTHRWILSNSDWTLLKNHWWRRWVRSHCILLHRCNKYHRTISNPSLRNRSSKYVRCDVRPRVNRSKCKRTTVRASARPIRTRLRRSTVKERNLKYWHWRIWHMAMGYLPRSTSWITYNWTENELGLRMHCHRSQMKLVSICEGGWWKISKCVSGLRRRTRLRRCMAKGWSW